MKQVTTGIPVTAGSANAPATREEALAAARGLVPRIRARSRRADADRMLPPETVKELRDSGLFFITIPAVYGGTELGFAALVEVTAELSAACGSTGWVYGVLAGHSWLLNLFPVKAQQEVYSNLETLTATVFRLKGRITPEGDGYRLIGGEGRFCSGIDYADWVIVGNAVIREGNESEPRFFIIPREDLEVVDDWFTAGMRGTGSRSIRVENAFIPEYRSVRLEDMLQGTTPGGVYHGKPLYRLPFTVIAPFSIVGVPMGIARGGLDIFTNALSEKLDTESELAVARRSPTMVHLGEEAANVDAAFALVLEDARKIDGLYSPPATTLSNLDETRFLRDWAYAVRVSRYAVTRIFELAGGSEVYDTSDLQRIWRDVNSAAQHYAFNWDRGMFNYGRAVLGLDTDTVRDYW